MSWYDPTSWKGLGDVPIIGDAYNALRGNPDAIKAAYDKMIAQSQAGGENIKNFLMGQQAKAQQFYAPVQSMMSKMYGTQGIAAPLIPGAPGRTQTMYGGMK